MGLSCRPNSDIFLGICRRRWRITLLLQLENEAGNVAWLQVSCTEWKNLFSFEIYGKRAKLHVEGLSGSYGVERLSYYRMLPEMGPLRPSCTNIRRGDMTPMGHLETLEFIEDVRRGRAARAGCCLKAAAHALEVVEKSV